MTEMNDYHVPVLLKESVEGLNVDASGTYVDATFGGGGHSREILGQLTTGRLIVFDQDEDAGENVPDDNRIEWVDQNFRFLKNNLRIRGVKAVDGVLADLGVSSHQFNVPARGFSFRFEAPLDMRMDQQGVQTAAIVLKEYEEEALADMFFKYGELRNSRAVAAAIVAWRNNNPLESVQDLLEAVKSLTPKFKEHQFYAKLFQALRIEVNDEMGALRDLLEQAVDVLKPGGRLVVMSYHSLEDRLVKHFMKFGNFSGRPEKDFYGNLVRPLKMMSSKPVVPGEQEIKINNRARSARLRIAEKL